MKKLFVAMAALALTQTAPIFADHGCTCDKECQEACNKGEGHQCKCKECDCAKSGKCGETCKHHAKDEKKVEKKK